MRARDGHQSSKGCRFAVTVSVAALVVSGCAKAIDTTRRNIVSAGLGGATLNPGAGPEGPSPEELEFNTAVSTQVSYGRRLSAPERRVALLVGAVGQFVLGAGLRGGTVIQPCDLHWSGFGPTMKMQVATHIPLSFGADAGVGIVHVSRRGCAGPGTRLSGDASASGASPILGFTIEFGLTSRIGWSLGGHWFRLPLDDIDLQANRRWAGAGAISIIVAF